MIWLLQTQDGYMIDIRKSPVQLQRQAFAQGLIPYVPAERNKKQPSPPVPDRVYQFKITLRETEPPIWRRIQVPDNTLDKLHEFIQGAMGWSNSHLHEFMIEGKRHGDPLLLDDDLERFEGVDSTTILISEIVPQDGSPFPFEYEYDFGDGWAHEILFEGSFSKKPEVEYPLCLEGERACPPEDVGGVWGFTDYLKAMADADDERHDEVLQWRGPYNPNAFNPKRATQAMQEGLPDDWKKMV